MKKFSEILESMNDTDEIDDIDEGKSGIERKYDTHLSTIQSNMKEVKKLVKQEKFKEIDFCLNQCKKEIDSMIKFNNSISK